jgi:hypothetical protein
VPLEVYKENLKKIIQHPATRAQNPRIVIITIPPVNEYQLEKFDNDKDTPHPSRTASLAKTYATAAREVGASLNVAVADVWSAFMATTGWTEGQPLAGSRDLPNNEEFSGLFTDGMFDSPKLIRMRCTRVSAIVLTICSRSASHFCWIPNSLRGSYQDNPSQLA